MINLNTPINNLGYGVAGYNIFKELYKLHPSTALYPISQPEFANDVISAGISNQGKNEYPSIKIWHQNDLHSNIGKTKHVGFPIFELTEFSDIEIKSMEHCDSIFVCSKWAKEIVVNQTRFSKDEVHVVPLGVDLDTFQPSKFKRPNTIFFNCGKWEKRKGHDILLECFNNAFSPGDNVELWMMCENPFIGDMNKQWIELYKNSPLGNKIRIIPRQKTHKDVYSIMAQADCGVFPARAEGWNLELLEMMACGKAVIATNYSAHTEFCNKDNAFLIDIDGLENAKDGVFFSGSHGEWASLLEPQKEQLTEYMKSFHHMKSNGWVQNFAGTETANKFTWRNSVKELLNGL